MSNSYLMGAMLDPLVVEFMPPAYCEAMLEAKIRTDEIRGNCPPRAGYVCVLDNRVKGGRYYRKQVKGEGVNALPPSRVEKAIAQQESRSQKGEGISFLGKAAIAGGLAVGGLAAIGAIANSGRSTEPVPDVPNAKVKPPDTSEKPKSSTYEEARQQAKQEATETINANPMTGSPQEARRKRGGNPKSADEIQAEIDKAFDENEKLKKNSSQGIVAVSPQEARKKRGSVNQESEAIAEKLEILKQTVKARGEVTAPTKPDSEPVSLTKTTQTSPDPEVTPAKKPKEKKSPVDITSMTAREASNAVIRDGYANIPDKAGAQNIGYKSNAQLRSELAKAGVIRSEPKSANLADYEALLDNNMLVEEGFIIQKKSGAGGVGKDKTVSVRVPAFMPVKDLSNAASNIYSEGKGGAGITDRVSRAETLVAAITEKLDKAKDLTELERSQLVIDRNRLTDKINVDNAKIKGSVIAEVNKPTGKPKVEPPKQPKQEKVERQVKRQAKLEWLDAKEDAFLDKLDNLAETDEKIAKFNDRANKEAKADLSKRIKEMHDNIDLTDPANKLFSEDLRDKHYKIFGKPISAAKTIAIAKKPPEDPNTFPLETPASQAPVVRPELEPKADNGNPSTPKSSVEVSNQNLASTETLREAYKKFLDKKKADEVESLEIEAQDIAEQVKAEKENTQKKAPSTRKKKLTKYQSFTQGLSNNAPPTETPVEITKQPEVKTPKPQNKRSSKKQAPKPEDFPIDIPTIQANVKIMENDLQKNEGRLEALRRQKGSQPEKIAALEKIIEKQRKEVEDKKQEVFDYIQGLSKNDAIASHENYYSAKEQARQEVLRRFAA